MGEHVYAATSLTPEGEIRGRVGALRYQPPRPKNNALKRALWDAGELQLLLGWQINVIERESPKHWWRGDRFDIEFVSDETHWMRNYGPFTASELSVYLRGMADGYRFAVR